MDQNTQYIYQESKLRKNNDLLPFLPPQAAPKKQECRGRSPLPGFGVSPISNLPAAVGGTKEKIAITISKDV
jgi:hypothetical protein